MLGLAGGELAEPRAEGLAPLGPGCTKRRHFLRRQRIERLEETRVEFRLGEESRGRVHQRLAQMEIVARELEVEEGRLRFLELTGDREHVVGKACRFREGNVDHHHELKGRDRFTHARTVGEGMRGIAALYQERADALWMVGQDFVRNHIAGSEPTDDAGAGHWGAARGAAASFLSDGERHEGGRKVGSSLFPKIARQEDQELVQVRD